MRNPGPRPCRLCRRKRVLLFAAWCPDCFPAAPSTQLRDAGRAFFRDRRATWEGRDLESPADVRERELRQAIRETLSECDR